MHIILFKFDQTQKAGSWSTLVAYTWTLMQSACIENAFPSDTESIRGSHAFKVSITMSTDDHASYLLLPIWNRRSQSSIRKEMWESNFLTVFIELRWMEELLASAHFTWCARYAWSQARGQHRAYKQRQAQRSIDTVQVTVTSIVNQHDDWMWGVL